MGNKLEVKLTGEAQQLMTVLRAVHQEENKVAAGTDKITEKSKAAAAAQRRWGREASSVLKQIESPMERHVRRVAALKGKLAAATITQKQYSAAVLQSLKNTRSEGEALKKAADQRKANTPKAIKARKDEQEADRKAIGETKRLEQARRAVYERTQSPQRAYINRVRQARELLRKNLIGQREYRREVELARNALRGVGQAQASAFGSGALSQLKSMVMGYVGVVQVIGLVTRAIEDKQEVERRSRDFTITVADAQIKALRNLGPVSDEERADFVKRMRELNSETKPAGGLQTIYLAASTGLSSSGGNVQATEDAIRAAASIAPESPEEITAISGALLHMGKATGTQDAEKNLGFLLGVGQQAAVTSMDKISRNLAPAIIGVTGYGGAAQEAGSIVAAMTQGMADTEGRMSGTASIGLAKQLREFLPEKDTFKTNADGERELDVTGTGLASTLQRIRYLQEHPLRREEFLGQASFEKKAQIPIEQMLAGGQAATARFLDEALQKIPKAANAAPIARSMIRGVNDTFEQGVAGGSRVFDTVSEELKQTPEGRARAAAAVYSAEALDKLLGDSGQGLLARKYQMLRYHAQASDPEDRQKAFEGIVEYRSATLRDPAPGQRWLGVKADPEAADILDKGLKDARIEALKAQAEDDDNLRRPQQVARGGGQIAAEGFISLMSVPVFPADDDRREETARMETRATESLQRAADTLQKTVEEMQAMNEQNRENVTEAATELQQAGRQLQAATQSPPGLRGDPNVP